MNGSQHSLVTTQNWREDPKGLKSKPNPPNTSSIPFLKTNSSWYAISSTIYMLFLFFEKLALCSSWSCSTSGFFSLLFTYVFPTIGIRVGLHWLHGLGWSFPWKLLAFLENPIWCAFRNFFSIKLQCLFALKFRPYMIFKNMLGLWFDHYMLLVAWFDCILCDYTKIGLLKFFLATRFHAN